MEHQNTATVKHVGFPMPVSDLKRLLDDEPRINFIHIHHGSSGQPGTPNIIDLARKDAAAKDMLVLLANAGFHLYVLRDGVSSMVRHRRIATLWRKVERGEVQADSNGIFYEHQPAAGAGAPKLLVVFSSVAGKMYQASLMRHFERNFSSIGKYVPHNTHILRIADFGSVLGSFYLNSHALPHNEANIWNRIRETAASIGADRNSTVLYGVSKGGTAAAFYALRHGLRAVAVDPILSDEHYITEHGDLHFTQGTFPATKQERFASLLQDVHPDARLSLICSSRSPQYKYIEPALIRPFQDRFTILNSENPAIKSHPDVGPRTISHMTAQLNLHLAGLTLTGGFHTVW